MASRKRAHDSFSFLLTPEERDLILETAFGLAPEITTRLRCGAPDGQCLSYQFPGRYVEQLLGAFSWMADHAQDEGIQLRFDELSLRMIGVLNGARMPRPDADPGSNLPPEMHEALNRVMGELDGRPIEEIEAAIGELMAAQNSRPQDDLCGLSPEQVYHLIRADWRDPSSSIQLTENIPLAELQGAEILVNARALLDAISAANGVKTTVSGNLNRKFVEQMLETLSCPPELVETLRKYCKVVNESDVMPLMSQRIVLTLAGLIKKTKGAFRITRAGEKLLAEAAAGGLYAALFVTYFRKFNLAFMDRMAPCDNLQHMIAYSFCVIGQRAGDWRSVAELTPALLLPAVAEEIPRNPYSDLRAHMARSRILDPLHRFGLLEFRLADEDGRFTDESDAVRKTPLFDRFLRFNL